MNEYIIIIIFLTGIANDGLAQGRLFEIDGSAGYFQS